MKIINELPKVERRKMTVAAKRIREIERFARTGAKYGQFTMLTYEKASSDCYAYKKALKEYKASGGDGDFEIRSIGDGVYIIRKEPEMLTKKPENQWL